MRRWLLATAVGSCLGGSALADGPKKADPPAKAEASPLKAAWDKYQADLKEKVAEARKAPEASQRELFAEIREFQVIELDKLFEVAEKEPATPTAFEVFSELLFTALDKDKAKKARELVVKHHLDQPHVKKILPSLPYSRDDKATDLLAAVAEKNKDKECQGLATFGLGTAAKMKAKQTSGQSKADLLKAATEHFTAVKTRFADVKMGADTLGKLAEGQLLALKTADQLQVGKTVPDLSGEDTDGKAMKLSDYRGKVVLLDFWAFW